MVVWRKGEEGMYACSRPDVIVAIRRARGLLFHYSMLGVCLCIRILTWGRVEKHGGWLLIQCQRADVDSAVGDSRMPTKPRRVPPASHLF